MEENRGGTCRRRCRTVHAHCTAAARTSEKRIRQIILYVGKELKFVYYVAVFWPFFTGIYALLCFSILYSIYVGTAPSLSLSLITKSASTT
jgi:hypothetical protein